MSRLGKFEGKSVVSTSIRLRKAGDGLSKELKIEPQSFRIGDRVSMVLTGVVGHVDHRPAGKDLDVLDRQHSIDTEIITIVPYEAVEGPLAAAQERIDAAEEAERLAEEKAKGIHRLPVDDAE